MSQEPNYYELWSSRVREKQVEIDSMLAQVSRGMELLLRDACLDPMMYNPKGEKYPKTRIGAVDGGEGIYELAGVAAYLVRASGFCKGDGGKDPGHFLRNLDLGAIPINRQTKARVQLLRSAMEYEMGSRIIDEMAPDYLLIDGSLLVGTEVDPISTDEYHAHIRALGGMLRKAQESGVRVVGVSEDSTSRGLISYLSDKGLSNEAASALSQLTDASLIQLYSQRMDSFQAIATKPFIPVSSKGRKWVKDKTGIDCAFPTFYLQATEMGRAMRVDFPSWGEKGIVAKAEEISSLLSYLSRVPKRYGYPIPLYMAHSDAELPQKLMEKTALLLQKQIFRNWGKEYCAIAAKKRRDSRPIDYDE